MKKKTIILALGLALSAATAYAIDASDAAAPTIKGFNPTNNVSVHWIGNADSSAWAGISWHANGDKQYWTSSAFGGLAYKEKDASPAATGAPSTATDSTVASSYTTM